MSSYSAGSDLGNYMIKTNQWYAQYFLPSLPADTISWKVPRVQFEASSSGGTTGKVRVQLQSAGAGGLPSGMVLEEKVLLESTLTPTYAVQEYDFANATGLSPGQGLCPVFEWVNDGTACLIRGQSNEATPTDGHLLMSTDGGGSWSVESGESLLYSVYGTVTTAGTPQIEATQYLGGVTMTVQTADDETAVVRTAVRVLNAPEMTP